MVEPEHKASMHEEDDDSAVGVPDGGGPTEAATTVGDYEKVWDAAHAVWYFVSRATGDSYWEVDVDGTGLWMEVTREERPS
jgi:hypothetical protein